MSQSHLKTQMKQLRFCDENGHNMKTIARVLQFYL